MHSQMPDDAITRDGARPGAAAQIAHVTPQEARELWPAAWEANATAPPAPLWLRRSRSHTHVEGRRWSRRKSIYVPKGARSSASWHVIHHHGCSNLITLADAKQLLDQRKRELECSARATRGDTLALHHNARFARPAHRLHMHACVRARAEWMHNAVLLRGIVLASVTTETRQVRQHTGLANREPAQHGPQRTLPAQYVTTQHHIAMRCDH